MKHILRLCVLWALIALAPAAWAQDFPKLTGRVVDAANLLDPAREQALTARLAQLEQQSGRQLVVATVPSLQDYDIADYGYRLGRAWGIGEKDKNSGALLIVAPNERKVRIESGYGLEGILTDALASRIIRETIIPRFKSNDYPGGIEAGTNALITLLTLPPDEARAQAVAAEKGEKRGGGNGFILIFWIVILLFFILPMLFGRRGGRRHRRGGMPVVIWGPGLGGGGSDWGGGGSWGGGFGSGGGGFSGGGGSFGGGGASGDW